MQIQEFNSVLKDAKYLLLGEMHGVKENIELLDTLILSLKVLDRSLVVGFEWPQYAEKEVNDYLKGESKYLHWEKWEFIKDGSGRISEEHLSLLRKLKALLSDLDLYVVCFDVEAHEWNTRDENMANIVIEHMQGKPDALFVGIMGSFHARKKEFILEGSTHIPLGSFLPSSKTISCELKYDGGRYFNAGLHTLDPREDDFRGIKEVKSEYFDYEIFLTEAHPVTPLAP